jgi:ribosome-binding protein aMBF1 (putative translation factor)
VSDSSFPAPHDGSCRFCPKPIKAGQPVKDYDWSSWYHAACVDEHWAKQNKAAATVRANQTYAEMAEVVKNLPSMVREKRRERGLPQWEMAAEMGINVSSVNRLERGRGVSLPTLVAILGWLGTSQAPES